MNPTNSLVSAISLNYCNANAAVRCVEQLKKQTIAERMEILVVDNHSNDDSIGILRNQLRKFSDVRIIETPRNCGFGAGYNTGVSYASGTYILVNNPDKVLQEDGVEKLVEVLESDPTIGILAPKLVHDDGTRRLSMRTFPSPFDIIVKRTLLRHLFPRRVRRFLMLDSDPDVQHDTDWVVGGCFMISRELFEKLGGFDDRFFLFLEDTDLCRRVHALGKRVVYYPQVVARDRKRRLSGDSLREILFSKVGRIHIASAVKYFWKWGL